jgi:hypothetical protein
MTIAIVSTLVQPAARATASQSVARAGEATDEPGPATDFASLLLGVVAPPLPAGPASDETVPGESSLVAGDPALAAGLPPPALPTPTALRQEIESARGSRIETVPGTAADKPGDEPPMRLAASDELSDSCRAHRQGLPVSHRQELPLPISPTASSSA